MVAGAPTAAEVAQDCELAEEARRLLGDGLSPGAYLSLLLDRHLDRDALAFLAHGLARRDAVWWATLCTWRLARPDPPSAEAAALRAAVAWVQNPSEDNRRRAGAAGEAAGIDTPAGAVALAAFWSGGSMAPAGLPEVAPPPFLAARTVTAAVNLGLTRVGPEEESRLARLFVGLGLEVASGANRWE